MTTWQTVLNAALANAIGGPALAGVTSIAPDVNRDGMVSAFDVALVGQCLGQHPQLDCATADVDQDGDVENADPIAGARRRLRGRAELVASNAN